MDMIFSVTAFYKIVVSSWQRVLGGFLFFSLYVARIFRFDLNLINEVNKIQKFGRILDLLQILAFYFICYYIRQRIDWLLFVLFALFVAGFSGKAERRCQEHGESQSDVIPVSGFMSFLHHKALNFNVFQRHCSSLYIFFST